MNTNLLRALNCEQINHTTEHYLGPMDVMCHHCQALFFRGELQSCCKNGQLTPKLFPKLLEFENISQPLKDLYDGRSEYSDEFFSTIRGTNTNFACTSFGISDGLERDQAIQTDCKFGGFSIVIHGQLYHQISPLMPHGKTAPTFSQILFYDNQCEELKRRQEILSKSGVNCSQELLNLIQQELHCHNQLYKQYKAIGTEIINGTDEVAMVIVEDFQKIKILKAQRKLYERPSVNDFAVLIPNDSNLGYSRDIVIRKNDDHLVRIDPGNPAVDPLSYPLLFPNGTLMWSPKMEYDMIVNTGRSSEQDKQEFEQSPNSDLGIFHPEPETANAPSNFEQQHDDDNSPLDDWSEYHKKHSLTTKATTITLYLFINFFLYTRKDCFNLLFKGKFEKTNIHGIKLKKRN